MADGTEETDEWMLNRQMMRSEQYRIWLAKTRRTVERAIDRPAPVPTNSQRTSNLRDKNSDFLNAVICNKTDDVVKMLVIDKDVDPNVVDSDCNTALLHAVKNGNKAIVEALIKDGRTKFDFTNYKLKTALMCAARSGDQLLVNLLLTTSCDVNLQDEEGYSALMLAVKYGHSGVVESLLTCGRCEVDQKNKYGQTVLHEAAKSGKMDLLAMMVFQGADKDAEDRWRNTPLMYATLHNHRNCVALLVQSKCNLDVANTGGRTALHTAAQNGHANIVTLLLQSGANPDIPDSDRNTPVLLAGRYQHANIFRMLVQYGCDIHATGALGKNAFHVAAANGYDDMVLHMLQPHFHLDPDKPDANGNTALFFAVQRNHIPVVRILLYYNCNVNRTCWNAGKEDRMFAAVLRKGYIQLIHLLAEAGADVSCYYKVICEGTLAQVILEDLDVQDYLYQLLNCPKSLMRLCRDCVRQSLGYSLESELEYISFPAKLKDYILMKSVFENDDSMMVDSMMVDSMMVD